jgi:hypothetical protein
MPVTVKGGIALRKALRKFTPDLAKETQKEMASLLRPITVKARGFVPSETPLSGWGKAKSTGKFPVFDVKAAKGGIGYKTTPSRPNSQGFTSLARIHNKSASGAIYETAGRTNPSGSPDSKSPNPQAGAVFIASMNRYSRIADAGIQAGGGRRSRKMIGRGIFRAFAEDGGKTNAAVIKAIENARDKFNKAVGYN